MNLALARRPRMELAGTLALAFGATMAVQGITTSFGVLYPTLVREQGWTTVEVTGAFSISQLAYGLVSVGVGLFVDRFGVRPTMVAGCIVLGSGLAWLAQAVSLWEIYLAWTLVAGVGFPSIGFVPVIKLLSLRIGHHFNRAVGVAVAGPGIGTLVMAPAFQLAVDALGWRLAIGAMAAVVLALLVPLIAWGTHGASALSPDRRAAAGLPRRLTSHPALWLLGVASVSIGYLMLLPVHLVAHLLQAGFSPVVAAGTAGLMGLFQAAGALTAGWLLDRWGSVKTQLVAATMFVIGLGALLASTPALALLPLVFVLVGAPGRGAFGVVITSVARRHFGGPVFGRVTGVIEITFATGALGGAWLVAFARDVMGSYVPGLATAMLATLVVALCLVAAARYRP